LDELEAWMPLLRLVGVAALIVVSALALILGWTPPPLLSGGAGVAWIVRAWRGRPTAIRPP
jgi:hypothetical protein